ncbi:MAG: hypothetical protein GY696_28620 [Gammaproteobacteria bacterium]|nr:hypothetical protein [Gammaproteobacteria bacterium]
MAYNQTLLFYYCPSDFLCKVSLGKFSTVFRRSFTPAGRIASQSLLLAAVSPQLAAFSVMQNPIVSLHQSTGLVSSGVFSFFFFKSCAFSLLLITGSLDQTASACLFFLLL